MRTPNLDRLAAGGVVFEGAYCNSPVCTASRQSFLTGRYPRSIGVTQLQTALPADAPTMAGALAAAGFDTAAIGKMHFNSPLKHGFDLRIDMPQYHAWLKAQPAAELPAGVAVQPPWHPFKDPARVWLNSECRPVGQVDAQMDASYFAQQAADYLAAAPRNRSSCWSASTSRTRRFAFRWSIAGGTLPRSSPRPSRGPRTTTRFRPSFAT